MLRNFSLIKTTASDSVATWHVWNQYIDWLNSDIDSLQDYLRYFNPDYALLNETLYATNEDGTWEDIKAVLQPYDEDIDTAMYQLGYKGHCYIYHYKDDPETEFISQIRYVAKVNSDTTYITEYLVDDNGVIWVYNKETKKYEEGGVSWGSIVTNIEVYTIYFPALLHFHQGMLNTDSNSLLFFGTTESWRNAGGDIIEGNASNFYFINYNQYVLLKENKTAESTAFRLWDSAVPLTEADYTHGFVELKGDKGDGIGLRLSTEATTTFYPLDQIRVKEVDSLTYYYTFTQLVPIRDFPVATVIISNAQTETGTDTPGSVERQDPDNYILIPRGSPSIYSVSFKDDSMIFTYDEGVASAGLDSIFFSLDLWPVRYFNTNDANQFWTAGSYSMSFPAAYYAASWQLVPTVYIGDKIGRVWGGTFPLAHELQYIHEGKAAMDARGTITVDDFICDNTWSSGLSNVANKIVSYYNINVQNNNEAMMDYSGGATSPHIFINIY